MCNGRGHAGPCSRVAPTSRRRNSYFRVVLPSCNRNGVCFSAKWNDRRGSVAPTRVYPSHAPRNTCALCFRVCPSVTDGTLAIVGGAPGRLAIIVVQQQIDCRSTLSIAEGRRCVIAGSTALRLERVRRKRFRDIARDTRTITNGAVMYIIFIRRFSGAKERCFKRYYFKKKKKKRSIFRRTCLGVARYFNTQKLQHLRT